MAGVTDKVNLTLRSLYARAVILAIRPYIRSERRGWGVLYRALIGDYRRNWLWRGQPERWTRGKLHGYDMKLDISGWSNRATYFLDRFYDLQTQRLLIAVLRPGDVFVDIGANEGMMALLAASRVGDAGRVIAFEPNPRPRARLREAIIRNGIANIDLRACGLADRDALLTLFAPAINSGEGTFTATGRSDGEEIQAPVRRGDAELDAVSPRLIKIDVEGFEFRVIAGLRNVLERARPVIAMELIARHLSRDGQAPHTVIGALARLGYAVRRLELVKRGGAYHLALERVPAPWRDGDYVFAPPSTIDTLLA